MENSEPSKAGSVETQNNPTPRSLLRAAWYFTIRVAVVAAAIGIHHWRFGIAERGLLTACVDGVLLTILVMGVVWTWSRTETPSDPNGNDNQPVAPGSSKSVFNQGRAQ